MAAAVGLVLVSAAVGAPAGLVPDDVGHADELRVLGQPVGDGVAEIVRRRVVPAAVHGHVEVDGATLAVHAERAAVADGPAVVAAVRGRLEVLHQVVAERLGTGRQAARARGRARVGDVLLLGDEPGVLGHGPHAGAGSPGQAAVGREGVVVHGHGALVEAELHEARAGAGPELDEVDGHGQDLVAVAVQAEILVHGDRAPGRHAAVGQGVAQGELGVQGRRPDQGEGAEGLLGPDGHAALEILVGLDVVDLAGGLGALGGGSVPRAVLGSLGVQAVVRAAGGGEEQGEEGGAGHGGSVGACSVSGGWGLGGAKEWLKKWGRVWWGACRGGPRSPPAVGVGPLRRPVVKPGTWLAF